LNPDSRRAIAGVRVLAATRSAVRVAGMAVLLSTVEDETAATPTDRRDAKRPP
jgi:hypothetical protein